MKKKEQPTQKVIKDFNAATSTRTKEEKARLKNLKNGAGVPGNNKNF